MLTRLTVLVIALAAACGGDSGPDDRGMVTPTTPEAFADAFAAQWCGLLARCCESYGGTVGGACEDDTLTRLEAIRADVERDGAVFDEARAAQCIDMLESASCEGDLLTVRALFEACDPWNGTVPAGGACLRAESCEEPADTAIASCASGTCELLVRQRPGDPCSETTLPCDDAIARCEVPAGETTGTCVALPVAGEACTDRCRADARCDATTCIERGRVGAPCTTGNDCATDVCHEGTCIGLAEDTYCTL